jgi:molybdopterin synthase catalytic subunit
MHVNVIAFGILKERLGAAATRVELAKGATVAELLAQLSAPAADRPQAPEFGGIAIGVNAEFAAVDRVLHEGDEVALLPPVSGGAPDAASTADEEDETTHFALVRDPIDTERLVAAAKRPEDGAVVVFDGIVRNESHGRQTLYLDYEAYEEMALCQLKELAAQARERYAVRHVTIVHRLGHLEIGESSVVIAVASGHRAEAFAACSWIIDTLKQTVPIWKKETFADGAVWADGEPFPAKLAVDTAKAKRNG